MDELDRVGFARPTPIQVSLNSLRTYMTITCKIRQILVKNMTSETALAGYAHNLGAELYAHAVNAIRHEIPCLYKKYY